MQLALRVPAFAVLLMVPLLAGCTTEEPAPPVPDLSGAAPFTLVLCKDGLRPVSQVPGGRDACNHRVTKPLADPSWFNWTAQHGPANEVSIAVDPHNPLRVAGGGKDYTPSYVAQGGHCPVYTVWMGTYWSSDGGVTWGNDLMPGFPGDPRDSPLKGNLCNTDPVLVWDEDGPLYYSGLNYQGSRANGSAGASNPLYGPSGDALTATQIYFAQSDDGGASYHGFSFCGVGDGGTVFHDKQWFAAQPEGDHLIVTWTPYYATPPSPLPGVAPDQSGRVFNQAGSYISFCESMDGGVTWSPQQLLRPGLGAPLDGQFSMPVYMRGGQKVAVIWATDTTGSLPADQRLAQGDVVSYVEGDVLPGGTQFGPVLATFPLHPVKSGPNRDGTGPSKFRMASYPVLAVDRTGEHEGRRYIVWADQPGPVDTDVQLLLRWSDDGRTWSEPVTVNDVERGDQFMPWIDVDPKGGVHVAWYDRRNDPTNRLLDIYYAYSDDGGESFAPNVRVSEASFDGDLGHHQSGAPFIGDYMGLDATEVSAHILWADTRHTGVEGGGRPAGSDVYAATLVRDVEAGAPFLAARS